MFGRSLSLWRACQLVPRNSLTPRPCRDPLKQHVLVRSFAESGGRGRPSKKEKQDEGIPRFEGDPGSIKNPQNWALHETVLYYLHPQSKPSKKIAAFGFNKAVATTSMFRRGPDAWAVRYADVFEKLKNLHKQGYKLVMFTNHSPIGRAITDSTRMSAILQQCGRTGGFVELLGVPMDIYIATSKTSTKRTQVDDDFRKPETGMWDFMVQTSNDKLEPDLNESFYVGGHAGREAEESRRADDNDYDVKFAEGVGIKFIVDDEYFNAQSKLPGPKMNSRPRRTKLELENLRKSKEDMGEE